MTRATCSTGACRVLCNECGAEAVLEIQTVGLKRKGLLEERVGLAVQAVAHGGLGLVGAGCFDFSLFRRGDGVAFLGRQRRVVDGVPCPGARRRETGRNKASTSSLAVGLGRRGRRTESHGIPTQP